MVMESQSCRGALGLGCRVTTDDGDEWMVRYCHGGAGLGSTSGAWGDPDFNSTLHWNRVKSPINREA